MTFEPEFRTDSPVYIFLYANQGLIRLFISGYAVAIYMYLQWIEIPKQISYVLRGIKRAIPRKLVKISDCRVSIVF